MKNNLQHYLKLIPFLVSTKNYQGHSSRGQRMSVCIPMDTVDAIKELSMILGKLQVYHDQADHENFSYIEKHLMNKCADFDIDMDDFADWAKENDSESEGCEEDTCETC